MWSPPINCTSLPIDRVVVLFLLGMNQFGEMPYLREMFGVPESYQQYYFYTKFGSHLQIVTDYLLNGRW